MRRLVVILPFLLAGIPPIDAQIRIYRGYADLVNNAPDVIDGYVLSGIDGPNKDVHLLLKAEGMPDKDVACADIWGFGIDSSLYRIVPGSGMPARVVVIGTPCFYENGGAHLTMLIKETTEEKKQGRFAGFLSDDLNGEMIGVSLTGEAGSGGAGIGSTKKFLKGRPEYADIVKCLNDYWGYVYVRECVRLHTRQGSAVTTGGRTGEGATAARVKGEGLEGKWSMTKKSGDRCAQCEFFDFRPDNTYSWKNAAFADEGRWRVDTEGDLVLYGRVRDGETPVDDSAPMEMKVKSGTLSLTSAESGGSREFVRVE